MKVTCTNKRPDGSPCGYVWKPGVSHKCKYSTPKSRGEKPTRGPRRKAVRCDACHRLYLEDAGHECEGASE